MSHPAFTLEEYRAATYHLTRPSRAQLEAFALHVSQAHSWYKSLSFEPPGSAFSFFIDPYAGMDIVQRAGAGFELQWRDKAGFHYNQLATAEHRERFGHLAFCSGGREMVPEPLKAIDGLRVPADAAPMIYDPQVRDFRRLPSKIMRAGVASFSSVVHDHTVNTPFVSMFLAQQPPPDWPAASGGPAVLERLRVRLAEVARLRAADEALPPEARSGRDWHREDPIVDALLAPERRRQHLGMIAAAQNVLRLIAGDSVAA